MTFDEFRNQARLFVIGALYNQELEHFTEARRTFGSRGEAFLRDCYALHEAFALTLRAEAERNRLQRRVMSMVGQHAS